MAADSDGCLEVSNGRLVHVFVNGHRGPDGAMMRGSDPLQQDSRAL
jgi:hypothetical protein